MNVYQRILNILLEARVDMFIQDRLDEKSEQARINKMKQRILKRDRGHKIDMLAAGKYSQAGVSAEAGKRANAARTGVGVGEEGPRQAPNPTEARRQIKRSQKVDGPNLP